MGAESNKITVLNSDVRQENSENKSNDFNDSKHIWKTLMIMTLMTS